VFGRITQWQRHPAEGHAVDYGPVEGVAVSVRGASFSRDVLTDAHGRYELTGAAPGEYTISVSPPPEFDDRDLERRFELKTARGCSEHDFHLRSMAHAFGTVIDGTGRSLAGVLVDAVAAELAGFQPPAHHQPARTNEHGRFEFTDLPPGTYVFGVNLTKRGASRPTGPSIFLPGTAVAREAAIIELKAHDRTDVGVLTIGGR
jgi:hypothetical protein